MFSKTTLVTCTCSVFSPVAAVFKADALLGSSVSALLWLASDWATDSTSCNKMA